MEKKELLEILEDRFFEHPERHEGIEWSDVKDALLASDKIDALMRMETSGGEVDVVKETADVFWFFDCAKESPTDRRSVCYDEAALEARKKHKPRASAEGMAKAIGAEMIDEEDYRFLQNLGEFDAKSQSWLKTDESFRKKGDALFGTVRHGRTFVYYNGPQSYYQGRGFRCKLAIEK